MSTHDTQSEEAKQAIGNVQTKVDPVAVHEFVERRLVDAGVPGNLIDTESTTTNVGAQNSGQALRLAAWSCFIGHGSVVSQIVLCNLQPRHLL